MVEFLSYIRAKTFNRIYIILFSSLLYAPAWADTHIHSLSQFIAAQDTIRVTADDGPGFGDQAASANIVRWLREKQHYTGNIEFVYGYLTKQKIISLFNLPADISDDYTFATLKIRFIKVDAFLKLNKAEQVKHITLGITAGVSAPMCNSSSDNVSIYTGSSHDECDNSAKFYGTDIFVKINPYPSFDNKLIINVDLYNPKSGQYYSNSFKAENTYLPVPVIPSLKDAKVLAENNISLSKELPALSSYIDGAIEKDFNILPVYGTTIRYAFASDPFADSYYSAANMLQIISAARVAQQRGMGAGKPLIIAVFYNYDQEINSLNEIIHYGNWYTINNKSLAENNAWDGTSHDDTIEYINKVVQQLGLKEVFSVASLAQPETLKLLAQIKNKNLTSDWIILLSMGASLPKDIFDALYANTDDNIWPQIREGASSFATLVATGKPHFRCASDFIHRWEIGYKLINDPMLKDLFSRFYQDIPENNDAEAQNRFCSGIYTWKNNSTLYQTLGQLFVDSTNPNSSLSRYFQQLKIEATKPENDRTQRALELGFEMWQKNADQLI